jgi:Fic family protein
MLFQVPKLTSKDLEVIAKIGEARRSLAWRLHTPKRWTGLLRRSTLGRVIRGSNSVEGYAIPEDDVVAAAEGETVTADEVTRLATETYRRAMTHVLGLSKDQHFEWSAAVVKGLHYMMIEYDMDKAPGQWRTGPIYVVDEEKNNETVYEGPDHSLVQGLMLEFVNHLASESTDTPEIVRAAMAHLNLVMIHPFRDGNGRMARCIQTLVLGRAGTLEPLFSGIEEYIGDHTRAYYNILADVGQGSWHPENDAHGWVQFCLRAHYHQAQTFLRRTREGERLMDALEETAIGLNLPERTTLALWDAAQGFKVRNGTYRAAAEVSEQTAGRDLSALVAAGLLIAVGEKRARAYVASKALQEVRRSVAEPRSIADPFEAAPGPATSTVGPSLDFTVLVKSTTGPSSGPRRPSSPPQSAAEE